MEEPTEVTPEAREISDFIEKVDALDVILDSENVPSDESPAEIVADFSRSVSFVDPALPLAELLKQDDAEPAMSLPTPLEVAPTAADGDHLPAPLTPIEQFLEPEIIPPPPIVGCHGTYARPDGNCITMIPCVVLSGTKAMARLSVDPSPGKAGFEVEAPHAEELYAGSWRLAR